MFRQRTGQMAEAVCEYSVRQTALTGELGMASARRTLLPILVAITLASCISVAATTHVHVVLPNPKLLGCSPGACSQLWMESDAAPDAKYPKQLRIDFSDGSTITTPNLSLFEFPNGVPYGLTAVYDKSVTIEDVEASINDHYSKWVYGDPTRLKLWRIEPEKFVIHLSSNKNGPEVIYLPIAAKSLLNQRRQ
jgi:hypothetical protein